MPGPDQQFTIATWLYGLTAVFWMVAALIAFQSYRVFRQSTDSGWTLAFLTLALLRAGNSYVAITWADQLNDLGSVGGELAEFTASYSVRLAALEMVVALAVLYLYRSKHVSY